MAQTALPPFVDQAELQDVVRRMLNTEAAAITVSDHSVLYGGLGSNGRLGIRSRK
jgi:hypothetical protein